MAKKTKEAAASEKAERSAKRSEEANKRNAPIREARKVRAEAQKEEILAERERQIDLATEAEEEDAKKAKVTLLDGKPGSGSGLKPGDLFAPKSNPGAAARVPHQPLQPESLQSHGKGILYDKDLDNPPFESGDPEVTDRGPFGLTDEDETEAEAKKAEKASSRFKQHDPDNPTMGAGGKKDATASPHRIGTRTRKADTAGGSNSGS